MKRTIAAALALAMLLIPALPASAEPEVKAPSAVLMDQATGQVLYELNSHQRLHPASVTKVMTLLLIMEAIDSGRISMDDTVTASANAASKGGSQIYLEEGEQLSMDEMLKSVVVSSANDCAVALAEHLCGSESAFVELMNQRAAELGMEDTNFVNCTGLDDESAASEHLTSAYDIAIMSRELLKHDAIKNYTTIWMDTVRNGTFGLSNTNKLIRFYNGATGLKTGFTSKARYCLSATAERDGLELIATVMNAATSSDRFETAKSLLDYGFANYAMVVPEPEEELGEIPVSTGKAASVPVELAPAEGILMDKGDKAAVTTRVELAQELEAPVEKGQKVGELVVTANGRELGRVDILAAEAVPRLTVLQIYGRLLRKVMFS